MVDVIIKSIRRKGEPYAPRTEIIGRIKASVVLRDKGGIILTINNEKLGFELEKALKRCLGDESSKYCYKISL